MTDLPHVTPPPSSHPNVKSDRNPFIQLLTVVQALICWLAIDTRQLVKQQHIYTYGYPFLCILALHATTWQLVEMGDYFFLYWISAAVHFALFAYCVTNKMYLPLAKVAPFMPTVILHVILFIPCLARAVKSSGMVPYVCFGCIILGFVLLAVLMNFAKSSSSPSPEKPHTKNHHTSHPPQRLSACVLVEFVIRLVAEMGQSACMIIFVHEQCTTKYYLGLIYLWVMRFIYFSRYNYIHMDKVGYRDPGLYQMLHLFAFTKDSIFICIVMQLYQQRTQLKHSWYQKMKAPATNGLVMISVMSITSDVCIYHCIFCTCKCHVIFT